MLKIKFFLKKVTQESLKLLVAEVGKPRYGSYHVYLTNLLPKASVKQLAEADMQEVVKEVKEIYIDYLPIGNSCLISCSLVFCCISG